LILLDADEQGVLLALGLLAHQGEGNNQKAKADAQPAANQGTGHEELLAVNHETGIQIRASSVVFFPFFFRAAARPIKSKK
jgi:hypothetical protein